eukprot:COSAG01_NODE_14269_length_1474_cov_1.792000_3_plen_179_part_00
MKQRIIAKSNAVVTKFEEQVVKRSPELQIGKYYRKGKVLNTSINTTLRKIDPKGERFGMNVFTTTTKVADAVTRRRIQRALNGEVASRMTLSPEYKKLQSPKALTKQQYRHLAKSLRLLNDNNIVHNDIVGNVMLDKKTNLPVIIDFDEAHVSKDRNLQAFQLAHLGREFKVKSLKQT